MLQKSIPAASVSKQQLCIDCCIADAAALQKPLQAQVLLAVSASVSTLQQSAAGCAVLLMRSEDATAVSPRQAASLHVPATAWPCMTAGGKGKRTSKSKCVGSPVTSRQLL